MSEELFPPHIHASETRPHGPWIGKLLHTFLKQLFWKPPIIDHFQNWSLFWSIHFLYSLWDRLHCHYHAAVAEVSICWCWTTPAPAFCAPHMPEPEYRDGKGMLGWHHGGTTLLSCVWGVHPPMDSLGYFKPWLSYWRPRAKAVCHMSVLSGMGILPVLLNPLQNILPSPGLRPGTRISFLASLHSEELFHLPSFPPRNVLILLTFLSASLPKIRLLLSLSLTSSTVLYFSISCIFFSSFPSLWFISGKKCVLQWMFTNTGKGDRTKYKLDSFLPSLLLTFQEWSVICPSAKPTNLFQGLTSVCLLMWSNQSGVCMWHLVLFLASEG